MLRSVNDFLVLTYSINEYLEVLLQVGLSLVSTLNQEFEVSRFDYPFHHGTIWLTSAGGQKELRLGHE